MKNDYFQIYSLDDVWGVKKIYVKGEGMQRSDSRSVADPAIRREGEGGQ